MAQLKTEVPSCCGIAEGTLVLTKQGFLPIEEIEVGDFVVAQDGKLHKVINTVVGGKTDVTFLKAPGIFPILLTGGQELYVRIGARDAAPCWMTADELLNADMRHCYLGVPINRRSAILRWDGVPFYIGRAFQGMKCNLDPTDDRLWYLAGRYLGDGWMGKTSKEKRHKASYNRVVICCGKHKTEVFKAKIAGYLPYFLDAAKTTDNFIFSSIELVAFLQEFGIGARNKQIPGFVFNLPATKLCALLQGYTDSDGYVNRVYKRTEFTSVSKALTLGIVQIYQKLYHVYGNLFVTKGREGGLPQIVGHPVNVHDCYHARFCWKKTPDTCFHDGMIWYPITSMGKMAERHQTHNLIVDGAHAYVAENCIVHDFQGSEAR